MDVKKLEKYSSAITLSDMEIFIFPELMYSLVLANIMSPVIWQWRERECFKKLQGKNSHRKLMRLKQFIMDEYEFNLDLETWGLTSQAKELKRFEEFIATEKIAQSNALFGYHGDKYYFDVDIRRHFGLDKYDSDIIPYWKTETVEAMDAFRLKDGYKTAAGECVSLAALYAAAAFVVCQVPLDDIYMILTPLHSQNFIDIRGGILTNNRRLVTKTMWFNGTAISNKAQRALRNENVTIVAHSSGHVHCMYEDATIDKNAYQHFIDSLANYLTAGLDLEIFASFLRSNRDYQEYFQICRDCHGQAQFLRAEVFFHYEHGSNYKIAGNTHDNLLSEVSDEDFVPYELPGRIRCDKLDEFIGENDVDVRTPKGKEILEGFLSSAIPESRQFVKELADFVHTEPKLPSVNKNYIQSDPIEINTDWSREQIIDYLRKSRTASDVVDLAFYSYRDMENCDWEPFVKAAIERNPVSIKDTADWSLNKVYSWLSDLDNKSIYIGKRLAQPDEVINFRTGDGMEKAFFLANIIHSRDPQQQVEMIINNEKVTLKGADEFQFVSDKGFQKNIEVVRSLK